MFAQYMRPNPAWNRSGPLLPLWFKKALKNLTIPLIPQYIPASLCPGDRGVDPRQYPDGLWYLCRRLPRTRYLHPVAVWSLSDNLGNYAPPGRDTLKMLKRYLSHYLRDKGKRFEELLDKSLQALNEARVSRSRSRLLNAMSHYLKLRGERQWDNRVCMRREVPGETKSHGSLPERGS